MDFLVNHLTFLDVLKTSNIINAFRKIDRADFVMEEMKKLAYEDSALPIGFGQTISQPYTAAFMLELLQPNAGENILDVGFGSGWQTAILAEIVFGKELKNRGEVYAIEVIPELCEFGGKNIEKYNFVEKGIVKIFCKNAIDGLPEIAEKIGGFDKIIAAAALPSDIPKAWKKQLKAHGAIVAPIVNSIWRFVKKSEKDFIAEEFPGFMFVPFV